MITVWFEDENGQKWQKEVKAYCCPHCESELEFMQSDIMRAHISCSGCDYGYWVNIKSLENAKKVEEKGGSK